MGPTKRHDHVEKFQEYKTLFSHHFWNPKKSWLKVRILTKKKNVEPGSIIDRREEQ